MKIGLIGLTYCSGNKGCEALSYSFLEVLNRIGEKNGIVIEACLIEVFPTRLWLKNKCKRSEIVKKYLPAMNFVNVRSSCIYYKTIKNKLFFEKGLETMDCVFDFTYGDSFTDIYGEERFIHGSRLKKEVMKKGIPFILGSQTIGPFRNQELERIACDIIKESKEVYVRDQLSLDYTKKISGRIPQMTTDVAFLLPYTECEKKEHTNIIVGFNPSGLLWNGGYTRDNQFGLTVNYQEYCRKVIDTLLKKGCEVHLILHAYTTDLERPDNDLIAVQKLHEEFPDTVVSPQFATPMEAKSYIAQMDVFVGARMHATIGAFSAGIPVIPFSYSRKFEGLFNSLDYDCIVHGCEDTTEVATDKTIKWIFEIDFLRDKMKKGEQVAKEKTDYLLNSYEKVIFDCVKSV